MKHWVVIGERKDRGIVSRMFWGHRDGNIQSPPEFSCHLEDAIRFTEQKAGQAAEFLSHKRKMSDGVVECEPCCSGSNPIFDIGITSVREQILVEN